MKTVSVSAHFNGKHILLDESLELEPNDQLIVTVLPKQDSERQLWSNLAIQNLANAYGENEEEYSIDSVKTFNPEHEGK